MSNKLPAYVEGHDLLAGKKVLGYCRTTEISNRLAVLSTQNEDCDIIVETTGADVGAVARLELRVGEFVDAGPGRIVAGRYHGGDR